MNFMNEVKVYRSVVKEIDFNVLARKALPNIFIEDLSLDEYKDIANDKLFLSNLNLFVHYVAIKTSWQLDQVPSNDAYASYKDRDHIEIYATNTDVLYDIGNIVLLEYNKYKLDVNVKNHIMKEFSIFCNRNSEEINNAGYDIRWYKGALVLTTSLILNVMDCLDSDPISNLMLPNIDQSDGIRSIAKTYPPNDNPVSIQITMWKTGAGKKKFHIVTHRDNTLWTDD